MIKNVNYKVIIPVVVLLILISGFFAKLKLGSSENLTQTSPADNKSELTTYKLPLNGESTTDKNRLQAPINMFVVSNSVEARPQAGLSSADIVYEMMVEGQATRYLALYQGDIPKTVGPLRSLRRNFLDIALAYDASISHVGGDPDALSEANTLNARSFNEFQLGKYFYRSNDARAPHNLFTTNKLVEELNQDKNFSSSNFTSWEFSETPSSATSSATQLNIDYGNSYYNPSFTFKEQSSTYVRSVGGELQTDANNQQAVAPSSVIVLRANTFIEDEEGHVQIDLVGSGDGILFQLGQKTPIRWSKLGRDSEITLTNNTGNPAKITPGQIWVSVVPLYADVSSQ